MSRWKWSRKKSQDEGYQPVGDSVSWEIALSQAVTALDHAAKLSIETSSPTGMREVAVGWLAVASTLESAAEDEESDLSSEEGDEMYPKVGFLGAPMQTVPEEFDDEEDEDEDVQDRIRTFKRGR